MECEQHNGQAALEAYRQAHQLYLRLYEKERDSAEDQWYLAYSHYRMGMAKELLGDASAGKEFAESLKLRQARLKTDPKSVQGQAELMLALARCGHHAEASRVAAEVRKGSPKNAGVLYSVGCCYAQCVPAVAAGEKSLSSQDQALQKRYADLAVETLEQARDLGYRDRAALTLHPDLAPLRGSPPFQALLANVTKS
jgi:hypothetical protein